MAAADLYYVPLSRSLQRITEHSIDRNASFVKVSSLRIGQCCWRPWALRTRPAMLAAEGVVVGSSDGDFSDTPKAGVFALGVID